MIFHDIYSITIGEFAILLKTKDINRVKRLNIWLPKKIVQKAHNKLLAQHNENSNASKIKELVDRDFDVMGVNLDLLKYDIIQVMIGIYYKTWGDQKKKAKAFIDSAWKEKYGKEPTEADFKKIVKDKQLLIDKAEQTFGTGEKQEVQEYDFDKDVMAISQHHPSIRNEKLYLLPLLMDDTLNKLRANG